jgi:GNAT superfamily N-acetyltransferase
MPPATVALRPPVASDAAALAELMSVLGHPAAPGELAARLAELERLDPGALRLLAEQGGRVVGFVAAHLTPMLHRQRPVGRVTTLVVAEDRQGAGIGTLLLAAAEEWLAARGATRFELTTGDRRAHAHRFYAARGWHREGVRFVRELPTPRASHGGSLAP